MPYENLPFTRKNPGCILFLIDQSGSMAAPFGRDTSVPKAQGVADAINRLLHTLCIRCTKAEGVYDYFDVGVLTYGPGHGVGSAFPSSWARTDLVPISKVNDNPQRIEKRMTPATGDAPSVEIQLPIWVEPRADDGTPMCAALSKAHSVLAKWIKAHHESFPPIVLHITDGESTDGSPLDHARRITDLETSDGKVLLFNCHISSGASEPVVFPSHTAGVEDAYARMLFRMSSQLPPPFVAEARAAGVDIAEGACGFAFNADLVELIRFLDIGTRSTSRLR